MIKTLILPILFLISLNCFSQTVRVVNAATQVGISFANVKCIHKNQIVKNVITDENGNFEFDKKNSDVINISCVGYENKTILTSLINNTIALIPVSYQLAEVVVNAKDSLLNLGYVNNKIFSETIKMLESGLQVVYIEKPIQDVVIQSFLFRVKKVKYDVNYRLHLYKIKKTNNREEPGDEILTDNKIYQLYKNDKGIIEVDLSDYNIVIPNEGIYIGIEGLEGHYINIDNPNQKEEREQFRKSKKFYLETVLCKERVYWTYTSYPPLSHWINFNELRFEHYKQYNSENEISNYSIPAIGLKVKRLN